MFFEQLPKENMKLWYSILFIVEWKNNSSWKFTNLRQFYLAEDQEGSANITCENTL